MSTRTTAQAANPAAAPADPGPAAKKAAAKKPSVPSKLISLRLHDAADLALRTERWKKGDIQKHVLRACVNQELLANVDAKAAAALEKSGECTKTSVKLPIFVIEGLRAWADEKGISMTALINQALIDSQWTPVTR